MVNMLAALVVFYFKYTTLLLLTTMFVMGIWTPEFVGEWKARADIAYDTYLLDSGYWEE